MKKRFIPMLLCVSLLLTLLAGCGSKQTGTTPENPNPADTTDDISNPTETPTENNAGQSLELKPETPTGAQLPAEEQNDSAWAWQCMDGFDYVSLPLSDTLQNITAYYTWRMASDADFIHDPNEASNMRELERRTNVHVDWTTASAGAATEQFSLMVTSGEWCDVIFDAQNYTGGVEAGLEDEVFMDLTNLIAENCPNYTKAMGMGDIYYRASRTNEGTIAGFCTMEYETEPGWYGVLYYKNLLNDYGLDKPVTLGDWENFFDAAMDHGTDFGYAMMTIGDTAYNSFAILSAFDTYGGFYQIDNTVHYGPVEENYRDALKLLRQWQEKGYLGNEWYGYDITTRSEAFGEERCVAIDGASFCLGASTMKMYGNTNPDCYVDALPNPVREEGMTNHFHQVVSPVREMVTAISTTAADPALCAKWIDYGWSNEGAHLWTYGVEGETYQVNADGTIMQANSVLESRQVSNPNYETAREKVAYMHFRTATGFWYDWMAGISNYTPDQFTEKWLALAWTDTYEADYMLPAYGILTKDLIDGYASKLSDINTYVEEMFVKFIIGEIDIDTEWDTYVAKIQNMDIQSCVDAQQRALDAYNAR